jgi:hypothetical protein
MGNARMSQFGLTRLDATTGARPSHPASCGAGTQKINPRAEIIRMPSGSIVAIPSLEPINLTQSRFNEALALALLINFGIWFLFALGVWALFF